ncbi:MAG: hypothetical protein AABX01_00515, partial [Candidatus Micrarchaeota archaeon]
FGSEYKIGLVDFDGETSIPAGSNLLLIVKVSSLVAPTSSSVLIRSVTLSDPEGKKISTTITKTPPKTSSSTSLT